MRTASIIERRIVQIRLGRRAVAFRRIKLVLRNSYPLPLLILAIPVVVVIRLIRPWLLVRWGRLFSSRIGHFALNTEMYLCERDARINVPRRHHVDVFFITPPISNQQLAVMWKRVLRVWPDWIRTPINRANWLIPGGAIHRIGSPTQGALDVHNLLDRFQPHLNFTVEEEARGEAGLRLLGISTGTPFVCLIVRDSAYLDAHSSRDWSYHNYRDSDIQSYVLAAEELADRGYYVIRMGAKIRDTMKSSHPRVIDYAANGMRSDFMDIYLGAKCDFSISSGTGIDAVPIIFRRPITWVNMLPLGHLWTFSSQDIVITRRHCLVQENRELSLREIFNHDAGFCLTSSDYESKGIRLIENTPEEIRNVVIEMVERLKGTWRPQGADEALQRKFLDIFPTDAKTADGKPLHGEFRVHFGSAFLRDNHDWLE